MQLLKEDFFSSKPETSTVPVTEFVGKPSITKQKHSSLCAESRFFGGEERIVQRSWISALDPTLRAPASPQDGAPVVWAAGPRGSRFALA